MNMIAVFRVVLMALCCIWTTTAHAEKGFILLASTIGPIDAGIVSELEDGFEKETGIRVRHVGAGTGEALKIAEKGSVDLVMVHARSLEEKLLRPALVRNASRSCTTTLSSSVRPAIRPGCAA